MSAETLIAYLIVVVLIALIGLRAGRAVAMDDVGEPIRRLARDYAAGAPDSHHRRWFVGLTKCGHCIGFWLTIIVGFVVTAVFLDADWITDAIIIAAATGGQSLFTTYAQQRETIELGGVVDEFAAEHTSEAGESDTVPPEGISGPG